MINARRDDLQTLVRVSALAALCVTVLWPVAGMCERTEQSQNFNVQTSRSPMFDDETGTLTCNPKEGGFLFVGNASIPRPYVFRRDEGQLYVNDNLLPRILGAAAGRKRGSSELPSGERLQLNQFARHLQVGTSFLVLPDQRPIRLDRASQTYSLLKALCNLHDGKEPAETDLDWLPLVMNREAWLEWLRAFAQTEEFLVLAKAEIAAIDEIDAANQSSMRVVRRTDTATYVLTSLGMLVSVLSIGHLLSYHPKAEETAKGAMRSAEARGALTKTLFLVAILASFDLVWTLLGSKNADVIEMNPLAGSLLDAPHLLILFKATATIMTIGLLFTLKEHRLARLAAWWACLILTLVVLRWLTVGLLIGS